MGNLTKEYYTSIIEYFRPDFKEKIQNGEFPIILAENGVFNKLWVSEEELSIYSHFHATDEDFIAQCSDDYFGWPIVHNENLNNSGIAKKETDGRIEEASIPYPDWSNWKP